MLYVIVIFLKGKKKLPTKKLFISHASKDKLLIDRFVDLVLDTGCSLNRDEIFYTSDPDLGIKPGKDFIDYIKQNLEDATLVILMISPNFYNSVFCLGELGATWALGIEIFPLIVPSLTFSDVGDLLKVTQMGMIGDKSYLDRLRDTVVRTHNIPTPKTATWNLKCDQFLRELPDILKNLPVPDHVKRDEHRELQETYQAALEQIQTNEKEITRLNQLIKQLESAKDKDEVANILLGNSAESENFDRLVSDANNALSLLPPIVRQVFYLRHIGETFVPRNDNWNRVNDYDEALQAQREGYIIDHPMEDNAFVLNDDDPSVEDALQAIKHLEDFLDTIESDSPFGKAFRNEYRFDIYRCLSNERFWQRFLYK